MENLAKLKEQYEELCSWYISLDDTDASTAFGIMKEASALQAIFERMSADLGKELSDYERGAKAVHATVSSSLSTKVNEGDRLATKSDEVITAWKRVSAIQRSQRYIDASAKHLSRIYFDSKLIFENACRATRAPVGGDKLVGHI